MEALYPPGGQTALTGSRLPHPHVRALPTGVGEGIRVPGWPKLEAFGSPARAGGSNGSRLGQPGTRAQGWLGFCPFHCGLAQVPRGGYRERMKKGVGVICLVGGVLVLVWGHGIAQSFSSRMVQSFTGSPPERAIHIYGAGAVLVLAGLFSIYTAKK